jgi:hypothetical protein
MYLFIFFATVQIALPNKAIAPSAKELMFFPALGIETDLSFTTEPIINKEVKVVAKKENKIIIESPTVKQPQPKSNTADVIDDNTLIEAKIIPVRFSEDEQIQQVIIEEEQSGNKPSALMVYNVVYEDGQWILQPQWMVTKTKQDSTKKIVDSTIPKIQTTQ